MQPWFWIWRGRVSGVYLGKSTLICLSLCFSSIKIREKINYISWYIGSLSLFQSYRMCWVKVSFFPPHEVPYKILLHYSIVITFLYIVKNDFYNIFSSTELQHYLYIWTAFCSEYHLLLHFQHLIMLNSRTEALSKAFLLLFHAELGNHGNSLTARFAHFFPSVLIRHSYLPDSIRHPTYPHFKKETTLCTTSFFVLPSQGIKERKVTKHDIFYTVSTFLREKVLKFRDCGEILAEVVGVLFISSRSAICCDFTYWDPALLFMPW